MRKLAPILLVTVSLAVGTQPAAAVVGPNGPITFEQNLNQDSFSWSLTGVPDIDQRRAADQAAGKDGLPGNGSQYCAPTTGVDIFAYLADLGYDTGVPSKDWTLDENYNEMTAEIVELGEEMHTSPTKATKQGNFVAGMKARLAEAGSQLQAVDSFGVSQFVFYTTESEKQAPSPQQMALAGLDGALAFPTTRTYTDVADPDGEGTVKKGSGGHIQVAVGASGIYGSPNGTVRIRDPATPSADAVQLPYTTDVKAVTVDTYRVLTKDGVVELPLGTWGESANKYWNGYYKIVPNTAWVASPPTTACRKGARKACNEIKRIRAYELVPPGPPPVRTTYDLPGKDPISALALSAATPEPAFLLKGSNEVWSLDPVTGDSSKLAAVKGARALVFGGDSQQLFVAGKRKLVALDGITGEVLASRKLAKPLAALAFDEGEDLLVGLARGSRKLKLFDGGLNGAGTRALERVAGKGKPLLAIAPDGGLLVAKSGSPKVFSADLQTKAGPAAGAAARLDLHRLFRLGKDVDGLVVDDLGHVLVGQGGKLKVFDRSGKRLRGSRFEGKASAALAVTQSFSNADESLLEPALDFDPEPEPRPPEPDPDPRPPTGGL